MRYFLLLLLIIVGPTLAMNTELRPEEKIVQDMIRISKNEQQRAEFLELLQKMHDNPTKVQEIFNQRFLDDIRSQTNTHK